MTKCWKNNLVCIRLSESRTIKAAGSVTMFMDCKKAFRKELCYSSRPFREFCAMLQARSILNIMPGSANFEILRTPPPPQKKKTKTKNTQTFSCVPLWSGIGLDIVHRWRRTILVRNSSEEKIIIQGITLRLESTILSTM